MSGCETDKGKKEKFRTGIPFRQEMHFKLEVRKIHAKMVMKITKQFSGVVAPNTQIAK